MEIYIIEDKSRANAFIYSEKSNQLQIDFLL
jgi:hypothetical protein